MGIYTKRPLAHNVSHEFKHQLSDKMNDPQEQDEDGSSFRRDAYRCFSPKKVSLKKVGPFVALLATIRMYIGAR